MATILDDLKDSPTLEDLYRELDGCHIQAGWAKDEPSLWAAPRKTYRPMQWRWEEGRAALSAAGRLVDTELAERRNLILFNPVEGNRYATVRTMICAYQMILPGETARSHRHTPNALRMVLEGEGAYTVVDGQRLDMKVNDVLLTPNWHWHGHGSEAEGPCSWLDCLDVPTTQLLEPMFYEGHPEGFEPIASHPSRSPYIFPWADVQRDLDRTEPDPEGKYGRRIRLDAPSMPTITLYMQRMEAGTETRPLQTTANNIFCAVEGAGSTVIDGERFDWRRGDVIAAPAWRPIEHHVTSDATLFVMTDEKLMAMLGWLREA
jgi:gentisate 1,2-dioxygenase